MADYDKLMAIAAEIGQINSKLAMISARGGADTAQELQQVVGLGNKLLAEAFAADALREGQAVEKDARKIAEGGDTADEDSPEDSTDPDEDEEDAALDDLLEKLKKWLDPLFGPPASPGGNGAGGEPAPEGTPAPGDGGGKTPEDCCCVLGIMMMIIVLISLKKDKKDKKDKGGAKADAKADAKAKAEDEKKKALKEASCVYVHGATTIWCWSRRAGDWRKFDFNEDIVAVETDKGGILAFSKTQAVLFDCEIGEFLKPLSADEALKKGGIKAVAQ